jgi:hypothetical protein
MLDRIGARLVARKLDRLRLLAGRPGLLQPPRQSTSDL